MKANPRHRPSFFRVLLVAATLALCSPCAFAEGPPTTAAAPGVAVGGEVATALHLDAAALAKMPRQRIQASAHDVAGVWEGVALADVLRAAGAPLGDKLRGKNLLFYVRIDAADGYHAVYALAELDPEFRDSKIILADRCDGKPLDAKEGPFRIIAAGEKRPARWVRQVTAIELRRAPAD